MKTSKKAKINKAAQDKIKKEQAMRKIVIATSHIVTVDVDDLKNSKRLVP